MGQAFREPTRQAHPKIEHTCHNLKSRQTARQARCGEMRRRVLLGVSFVGALENDARPNALMCSKRQSSHFFRAKLQSMMELSALHATRDEPFVYDQIFGLSGIFGAPLSKVFDRRR